MKNVSIPVVNIPVVDIPVIKIPVVDVTDQTIGGSEFNATNNKIGSDFIPSMNVDPVLHEVRHALTLLNQHNKTTVIDLSSMPFAPGEKQQLRDRLKTGEVEIKLDAMGTSYLHETSYPGVWWIEHYNSEEQLTGSYIEIASVPEIILADKQDIRDGLQRLTQTLQQRSESHVQ
jgi:hydrogenase-1 operon protein HyaF